MARKVGSLHAHKLPDSNKVSRYDVFRCECNKEFYMDATNSGVTKWLPLDSSPHLVEYSPDEQDAPRIGRWTPKPETAAEETQAAQGGDEVSEPDNVDDSPEHTSEGRESHPAAG